MASMITSRNLKGGDVLQVTFKGKDYTCKVKATKDGLRFIVDDDKTEYVTISGAGKSLHGSRAIGGYAFWSLVGEEQPVKAAKAVKQSNGVTASKTIKPTSDSTRGWCSACMEAFPLNEDGVIPVKCPKGHSNKTGSGLDDETVTDITDNPAASKRKARAECVQPAAKTKSDQARKKPSSRKAAAA